MLPPVVVAFVTSAEEGGYVFGAICLSVCLFVCLSVGLLANLWTDFDEIFWRGRAWLKDQVIQFWRRSGSRFGSGSPKSEIRILWIGGGLCSLSISTGRSKKRGHSTFSQISRKLLKISKWFFAHIKAIVNKYFLLRVTLTFHMSYRYECVVSASLSPSVWAAL